MFLLFSTLVIRATLHSALIRCPCPFYYHITAQVILSVRVCWKAVISGAHSLRKTATIHHVTTMIVLPSVKLAILFLTLMVLKRNFVCDTQQHSRLHIYSVLLYTYTWSHTNHKIIILQTLYKCVLTCKTSQTKSLRRCGYIDSKITSDYPTFALLNTRLLLHTTLNIHPISCFSGSSRPLLPPMF